MRKALSDLRKKMKENRIDLYIVPTDDFHQSEYVGDYFKCRAFLTGFTGSAGTAVVTKDTAVLFTDGRYFLQAEKELRDTGFSLMKAGTPGVPRLVDYVADLLPEKGTIGFDGRVMQAELGEIFREIADDREGYLETCLDLMGDIWEDRPEKSAEKLWIHELRFAGESAESKLLRVREAMADAGTELHLMASTEDIMWTLNLRGNDIEHCPVGLCFLLLTAEDAVLYAEDRAVTGEVRRYLTGLSVKIRPYTAIYEDFAGYSGECAVLLSKRHVSDRLYQTALNRYFVVDDLNPSARFKAVKNPVEQANARLAHEKDGVALVKWLYWLKHLPEDVVLTETDVAERLLSERKKADGFLDLSFATIAGYGPNGAIVHYDPKKGEDAVVERKGLLLVDSGAHYREGTTDVTRTIVMGPLSDTEKTAYTRVLRGHLNLAHAKFLSGTTGATLDMLARKPLWDDGLDYRHGTGHGVGNLLSVHEGPQAIRYRVTPSTADEEMFRPGMITSDEPGYYEDGAFGIRTESLLLCREAEVTAYGRFLDFEILTLCPMDLRAVDRSLLTDEEAGWLNDYHKRVYDTLAPFLSPEEADWLRSETREI